MQRSNHRTLMIIFLFSLLFPCLAKAVVQEISRSSQFDVTVTLYPHDIALIKEKRKALLKEGSNKLLIKDVPSSILVDSLLFQVIPSSPSLNIVEYTFQTPQITREKLLQHSMGQNVQVLPSLSGASPTIAKLVALDGDDAVVASKDLIFMVKKNKIAFLYLPYNLVPEPLITLKVMNSREGEYIFDMGYLAKGFSWDAGYTIIVGADSNQLDLNNWLNIHNQSGVDIKKGHFLVAHAERFYEIKRPISLADKATKNISWFSAQKLTPTKSYRIYPRNNIIENEEGVVMKPTVEIWLSVQNETSQNLGVPLPQGVIKVFRRKPDGSLLYVGENKTSFIPIGESFSLRVGNTKEITAEMRQTDYRKLSKGVGESGYRLDLKNTTHSPKQVTIFQTVAGEWAILRETHPHKEEDNLLKWTLDLAPQEEVSLRYRIRMNVE